MKPGSILVRADANVSIGTGHVLRCLALAQACQDVGGSASFAVGELPVALESRLTANGVSVSRIEAIPGSSADANALVALAEQSDAGWIVVDGDRFGSGFLDRIRTAGLRVLLIDDFADRPTFPADLIVNPNLGASPELYRAGGSAAPVLIGPRYTPLRREFQRSHARQFLKRGNRILITLGGSDPENLSPQIAAALAASTDLELLVVAGAAYANASQLQNLCATNVKVAIDSQNMADLMKQSDLAVIAAGGTLWELLSMGCAVLSYSRNAVQMRVVQTLAKDRIVEDMGDTKSFDPALLVAAVKRIADSSATRERMASRGQTLVDGFGAARIIDSMQPRVP